MNKLFIEVHPMLWDSQTAKYITTDGRIINMTLIQTIKYVEYDKLIGTEISFSNGERLIVFENYDFFKKFLSIPEN